MVYGVVLTSMILTWFKVFFLTWFKVLYGF
jgi:hypothetical protein